MAVLYALAMRENQRGLSPELAKALEDQADEILEHLKQAGHLQRLWNDIGAPVTPTLLRHGQGLLRAEFKD